MCDAGFTGKNCEDSTGVMFLEDSSCINGCKNRGSCTNGICNCLPQYFGNGCEYKHCTSTCGEEENRGVCNHDRGECDCQKTYGGDKCQYMCPYGCPEGLICVNNYQCACHNCPVVALNCNEHGTMIGDICDCIPGYCGKFCENLCPTCSGHGEYKGSCCSCFDGYYGQACEKMCINRCSGNGKCNEGTCECHMG